MLRRLVASWRPSSGARAATRSWRTLSTHEAEQAYHKVADETLHAAADDLESFADDHHHLAVDVEYAAGVLELGVHDGTHRFVLNKQAPNRQLWLSSPLRGPLRYDFDGASAAWLNNRDSHSLLASLAADIEQVAGQPVSFSATEAAIRRAAS